MISLSKELIGNNNLINDLIYSFKEEKLSSSLIFVGQKGVGKSTFAFYFIDKLFNLLTSNKDYKKDSNLIYNNSHPNIRYIHNEVDEQTGKLKNYISINQIRNLENYLYQSSFNNLPKFIIIDAADDLNINAANALLKVLEEPKKNTFFILITHQLFNLLPTIRSRCIKFYFKQLELDNFIKILRIYDEQLDTNNINFLYNLTNGSPGLAIKLNTEKLFFLYSNIIEILISNEVFSSQLNELSDKVKEFSNDEFKIFLMLVRYILITITKINLGYSNENILSSNLFNDLKNNSININNKITLEILEFINFNERNLFIYNLDKKLFCLNIFTPLFNIS